MSGHTKGPWDYVNTNAGYQIRMPHPGSPTGRYYGATVSNEADARLIAAAPDLLAACKEALRTNAAGFHIAGETVEAMRRAIFKAEGK